MIIYSIIKFFKEQWKSFIISIAASIFVTGITAFAVVYFFRIPNFSLNLKYEQKTQDYPYDIMTIEVVNKKRWVGFNNQDVHFNLIIPSDLTVDKKIYSVTPSSANSEDLWNIDNRLLQKFNKNGVEYSIYPSYVQVPIHPNTSTSFLRIVGNFDISKNRKIYYMFNTPYGIFPRHLSNYKSRMNIEENE